MKFFRDTLLNAQERIRIQPAFVLAALAMSTLMKSSETEYAVQGRTRALYLRNMAQSALEAAWESEWIDAALAEAALVGLFHYPCPFAAQNTLKKDPGTLRDLRSSGIQPDARRKRTYLFG